MNIASMGYIIRHKLTGDTLPMSAVSASKGTGCTHTELTKPFLSPPRLFTNLHSAEIALRHWLMGKRVEQKYVPQKDRRKTEMEIVKVRVTLEWD